MEHYISKGIKEIIYERLSDTVQKQVENYYACGAKPMNIRLMEKS